MNQIKLNTRVVNSSTTSRLQNFSKKAQAFGDIFEKKTKALAAKAMVVFRRLLISAAIWVGIIAAAIIVKTYCPQVAESLPEFYAFIESVMIPLVEGVFNVLSTVMNWCLEIIRAVGEIFNK